MHGRDGVKRGQKQLITNRAILTHSYLLLYVCLYFMYANPTLYYWRKLVVRQMDALALTLSYCELLPVPVYDLQLNECCDFLKRLPEPIRISSIKQFCFRLMKFPLYLINICTRIRRAYTSAL